MGFKTRIRSSTSHKSKTRIEKEKKARNSTWQWISNFVPPFDKDVYIFENAMLAHHRFNESEYLTHQFL